MFPDSVRRAGRAALLLLAATLAVAPSHATSVRPTNVVDLLAHSDTIVAGSAEGRPAWQVGETAVVFLYPKARQTGLQTTVGKRQMNRILFGYQYKQADFEDGDVGLDYTCQGPLAGFNFRF